MPPTICRWHCPRGHLRCPTESSSAALRTAKRFFFPSGLPILTGGDLRATAGVAGSGPRAPKTFHSVPSAENFPARQLHSGPLMPVQLSPARRAKKLAGLGSVTRSVGERHAGSSRRTEHPHHRCRPVRHSSHPHHRNHPRPPESRHQRARCRHRRGADDRHVQPHDDDLPLRRRRARIHYRIRRRTHPHRPRRQPSTPARRPRRRLRTSRPVRRLAHRPQNHRHPAAAPYPRTPPHHALG